MSNRVVAETYTGFSALTVSAAAVFPFSGLMSGGQQPNLAILTFEASSVRFSVARGFTATSGSGHLATAGDVVTLHGSDVLAAFNVCATAPTGTVMMSVGYL